jgi:hypothetical protein
VVDPSIKYGGGQADARELLSGFSDLIAALEQLDLNPGDADTGTVEMLRQKTRGLMQTAIHNLSATGT